VPILLDLDMSASASHPNTANNNTAGVASTPPMSSGGGGFGNGFGVSSRPITQTIHHRRHVVLVSCGANHSACVDSHGRVVTWGCYDGGRLGRKDLTWPSDVHPDDSAEDKVI
jgi:hypothetical protein